MNGSTIGKKAQALAAALVLGTTVVSLTPGEARAERKQDEVLCTQTLSNGMIVFHLPGEMMWSGGRHYYCNGEGQWYQWGPAIENPGLGPRLSPEERGVRTNRGGRGKRGGGAIVRDHR